MSRFAALVLGGLAVAAMAAGCAGTSLQTRAKPTLRGDRLLMDRAAVSEFKGSGEWWAARYSLHASDRALFTPCTAPKDSLYAVAITFPNSVLFLDRDGAQRNFLVTPTVEEKLMWTSEDGRVLCSYVSPRSKAATVDARIGTWKGRRLLSLDGFPAGEFFLGSSGGFVHLTSGIPSRDAPPDSPVRLALTFRDYEKKVLGRDSTGVLVVPRSWRASHSPDARVFAFAASWIVERGANDSLLAFEAPSGRRLWSRPLGGASERVRVGPRGDRIVVATALDDSTRRILVIDRKGQAVSETEVHAGAAEDIVFSCDGKLALIVGRGFRALVETGPGRFVYAVADPSAQLRKGSLSNTGQAFTVNARSEDPEHPVEAVLYGPDGALSWRTPCDASVPATDVWIEPDGKRLLLRVFNTLEVYD